ncbi:amino acid permease [Saccharopolyspora sp. NFXS83]|uniref:APC family permease n=1 Tax=Saccharopolyspora sp. NFXS83 TaxID=2993560 RepID=UPI00224B4FAA|nr:amino acid permease [Saccharopolyspora sp. NFXS83]MCX2734352.1 amino acid permease [Saccharopolyspora sp. NFXS83]
MAQQVAEQAASSPAESARRGRARRSIGSALPLALGGMLGAGLFVGIAPAALAAGPLLLLAVPLVLVAVACSALASAHQSASYRGPGAGYACIRARLGVLPARFGAATALAGKVAALAAIARVIAEHAMPAAPPVVSSAIVLLVVLAATAGLRIRGAAAWLWLLLTLAVVGLVIAVCFAIEPPESPAMPAVQEDGAIGITGAAGVLFFGFLGFERLTAPAEERDRHRGVIVKWGVVASLVVTGVVVSLLAWALLHQLGPARLALSGQPLLDALDAAAGGRLRPMVGTAVGLALFPVLLGVLESLRSTALAVQRDQDLPAALARESRAGTPYLLDLCAGVAAAVVALLVQPVPAMAFASCCLLVHHALANAAARVLLADDQVWRMRSACLGMGLAVILAMSMPVHAMLGTLVVVIAGPLLAGLVSRRWS